MTEFGYKVTLEADQCSAKRFAAFHSSEELSDFEAGDQARWRISSQTCPRCGANHGPDDYFPIHVEMELH